MKRSSLIRAIDLFSFVSFFLLLITGLLLRYTLPPGSGGLESFGGGRGAGRPVTLLWGLTRHEWGTVHFWVSVAFLAVMATHLFIHWSWIRASVRGGTPGGSALRVGLGLTGVVSLLAIAAFILLGPKEKMSRADLKETRGLSVERP